MDTIQDSAIREFFNEWAEAVYWTDQMAKKDPEDTDWITNSERFIGRIEAKILDVRAKTVTGFAAKVLLHLRRRSTETDQPLTPIELSLLADAIANVRLHESTAVREVIDSLVQHLVDAVPTNPVFVALGAHDEAREHLNTLANDRDTDDLGATYRDAENAYPRAKDAGIDAPMTSKEVAQPRVQH